MVKREVNIPPNNEGGLVGALRALTVPLGQKELRLLKAYNVAGAAIHDCMSVLPQGIGYIPAKDGRLLLSRSEGDIRSVRIIENADIERGFDWRNDRIRVENKGFYESGDIVSGLETRWELSASNARYAEKWGTGEFTHERIMEAEDLAVIATSIMLELGNFRAEIKQLSERPIILF